MWHKPAQAAGLCPTLLGMNLFSSPPSLEGDISGRTGTRNNVISETGSPTQPKLCDVTNDLVTDL
jgi:hypothetical protein